MGKKKDENQIQLDMGNAIDNNRSKLAQKEKLISGAKEEVTVTSTDEWKTCTISK